MGTPSSQIGKAKNDKVTIKYSPLIEQIKDELKDLASRQKIGRRKLDTHFEGLVKLGAKFQYDRENYRYNVSGKLKASYILLDQPSEGLQPSIAELIADVIWRQMEEKGVTVLLDKILIR